jgi:hypothetical protein
MLHFVADYWRAVDSVGPYWTGTLLTFLVGVVLAGLFYHQIKNRFMVETKWRYESYNSYTPKMIEEYSWWLWFAVAGIHLLISFVWVFLPFILVAGALFLVPFALGHVNYSARLKRRMARKEQQENDARLLEAANAEAERLRSLGVL